MVASDSPADSSRWPPLIAGEGGSACSLWGFSGVGKAEEGCRLSKKSPSSAQPCKAHGFGASLFFNNLVSFLPGCFLLFNSVSTETIYHAVYIPMMSAIACKCVAKIKPLNEYAE